MRISTSKLKHFFESHAVAVFAFWLTCIAAAGLVYLAMFKLTA